MFFTACFQESCLFFFLGAGRVSGGVRPKLCDAPALTSGETMLWKVHPRKSC